MTYVIGRGTWLSGEEGCVIEHTLTPSTAHLFNHGDDGVMSLEVMAFEAAILNNERGL
jgi:hypothetical protein